MQKSFPKLAEPGQIGNIKLKNRIIKAPQHTGLANPDGSVTDRMLKYYKAVAMGGVSMVIVEYAYVDDDASRAAPCQLGISRMDHVAGLSLLAQTIQANGAKAAIQISHAGRQKFLLSRPIKAPSVVPWEELYALGCPPPDELTFEEIKQIVKCFGSAARRAKDADFDMVEIHACHGYLMSNFLSPRTNKRTDWYGGSLENRMRFAIEVIEEVYRQTGSDYPVCVRVSGTDYEPDGTTIEETIELCRRLEKMGVATIHVSGGNHHQTIHEVSPMGMPLAPNVWAAAAIKKEVRIPVIASGSITNPTLAEKILTEDKGDFISLGRPLWADPYWPQKTLAGYPEEIRPCIRCNDGCLARGDQLAKVISCSVNAAICREGDFAITKSENPRKIAVIGGGPAGMEAARVSTLQGHKVTLFEKRELGGALLEASVPDFKADLRPLIGYFVNELKRLEIKVIKQKANLQTILRGDYDTVIIATGSTPIIPVCDGINNPIVANSLEVLNGAKKTGKRVAVIGAGMVGTEVGLYLAEQGKEVLFFEMMDTIMNGILPDERQVYENRLKECKVSFYPGKRLTVVSDDKITLVDKFGNYTTTKVDSVVLACGFKPERKLIDDLLTKAGITVLEAGDCVKPRKIFDAVHEGHLAARFLK